MSDTRDDVKPATKEEVAEYKAMKDCSGHWHILEKKLLARLAAAEQRVRELEAALQRYFREHDKQRPCAAFNGRCGCVPCQMAREVMDPLPAPPEV